MVTKSPARCPWVESDPLDRAYHDTEWGVPLHDDRRIFELLTLKSAQLGVSWLMLLKMREAYRDAFSGWDPQAVALYGWSEVESLMYGSGIVRNRPMIWTAVSNARAFVAVQQEFGSFDRYIWEFVGGRPKQNAWPIVEEVPLQTPEAEAMSRDLLARGFRSVCPPTCYAFMQATGMVNDHLAGCFRNAQVQSLSGDGASGNQAAD